MSQILDLLRPRDILTHCYTGAPNLGGQFTNIVQEGKLLPAALEAKKRGVFFDVGHGGGSFDYTVAEAGNRPGRSARYDLLGHARVLGQHPGHAVPDLGDEQVSEHGVHARAGHRDGHDQPGPRHRPHPEARYSLTSAHPAMSTLLDVVEGPVEFVDTRNNKRAGKVHLRAVQTVAGGIAFGRPFAAPFSVR